MMEYPIDEALSLLTKNLTSAKKMLSQVQEDLNFIRDQTTTTEVSILNNIHTILNNAHYLSGVDVCM